MPGAILVDLDGTLLDHDTAAARAAVAWGREQGVAGSDAQLTAAWNRLERHWFAAYERGERTHSGQRVERARGFLQDPQLSAAEALERYERYLELYAAHWCAFDDARDFLAAAVATGRPVAVLTNGRAAMQQAKLEATGLDLPGVRLVATVDLGTPKPDARAYTGALAAVGLPPEAAGASVMVGDNPVTDVAGALRAGLQAVLLDRAGTADAPAGVRTVADLAGLRFSPA